MPVTTTPQPASTTSTTPVYFWRPSEEGTGFLGQWYASPFSVAGDSYATAEMWMMVQKARLFGDEDVAREMLRTRDPKAHKALGRKVRGFDGKVWDASKFPPPLGFGGVWRADEWTDKFDIVVQGNVHKFTMTEDAKNLRAWLLATGDRELVEASPMDRIWGVGFGEKNAGANRHRWGQNLLGKALMVVRSRLVEEQAKEGKKEKEGTGATAV